MYLFPRGHRDTERKDLASPGIWATDEGEAGGETDVAEKLIYVNHQVS